MKDTELREHLLYLLEGGGAHIHFEDAFADFPEELRGVRVPGIPHTAWKLLEHMRIAQWDILEFSRNPNHISPKFPEGYWPIGDKPQDEEDWDHSLTAFFSDLQEVMDLVGDPKTDLFAPIPQGSGQTILREALLVADHNSYHLGQVIFLRKALGAWSD